MVEAELDPVIGIVFDREGHPGADRLDELADPERAGSYLCDEHLPLSEAMSRQWAQDAHLMLYRLVDADGDTAWARVRKRAPFVQELLRAGGRVEVPLLVFDHDLPRNLGTGNVKQEWTEEGLGEFVQGLAGADLPSPSWWYTTLHGSRFVYVLEQPVSHGRAEQLAQALMQRFAAQGVELDRQCSDWTRLFRLPRTVRADTGLPFHTSPRFMLLGDGRPVSLAELGVEEGEKPADTFVQVPQYAGDRPTPEEVRALLVVEGKSGKENPSAWAKVARKYLQGREPAFGACFGEEVLDVARFGGRNNAIVKVAGQVIGMTARQEEATPEGVYALLHAALEQLQARDDEGTDWHAVAWDIVCRLWTNEQSQIAAENAQREASVVEGQNVRKDLVEQLRAEHPSDVPTDAEEADAWFRQRMIASDGKRHFIMRRDGSYGLHPVGDSMVIPMVKELGMEDVIETNELRGRAWVSRSTQSILNDHATPIVGIVCSASDRVAYIEGERGHRVLHQPVHRLNPRVKARWSYEVDAWLKALLGEKYDIGTDWLAYALDVSSPICALNLWGTPGTGKGMLAAGLAECFEGEQVNDGRALGKFNAGLLASPVVNCDEGVPQLKSDETLRTDQAFRSLVTGGNVTIRAMHQNPFTAKVYPRILFTGNDPDIVRAISGHRDLTEDDVRAIEVRLLSIHVQDAALIHLASRGNYSHTDGWVNGRERSKYILAGHIRQLFENRQPKSRFSSGRLLVEGEVGTTLVREMRLRSPSAQAVLRSVVGMLQHPQKVRGLYTSPERVLVTAAGVVEFSERAKAGIEEKLSLPRTAQVLRQFALVDHHGLVPESSKVTPPGQERGRWVELDLGTVLEEAARYGMDCARVEELLRTQRRGQERITYALSQLEDKGRG